MFRKIIISNDNVDDVQEYAVQIKNEVFDIHNRKYSPKFSEIFNNTIAEYINSRIENNHEKSLKRDMQHIKIVNDQIIHYRKLLNCKTIDEFIEYSKKNDYVGVTSLLSFINTDNASQIKSIFDQIKGILSTIDIDLLELALAFHDYGRFCVDCIEGKDISEGEHPIKGYINLKEHFFDKEHSIFEEKYKFYSDVMILLQKAHLLFAGPALGENSYLNANDILADPIFKKFSEAEKIHFVKIVYLVSPADLSSRGPQFKTNIVKGYNKVFNYLLDNLDREIKMLSDIDPDQFFINNAHDAFKLRLSLLSANTPEGSIERIDDDYLYELFMKEANEVLEEGKVEEIISFMNSVSQFKYGRAFLQHLLVVPARNLGNTNIANKIVLKKEGILFLYLVSKIINKKRKNKMIEVTLGKNNTQGYSANLDNYYKNIILPIVNKYLASIKSNKNFDFKYIENMFDENISSTGLVSYDLKMNEYLINDNE